MANVNRPTDPKQKEKDINNKLQLYGIFEAFSNGKVPSNKQIDVALNSTLESRALAKPSSKLSDEGQHLVADLRDVIDKAKILLLTKNQGNLIQDIIWQSQHIDGGAAGKPGAPIDRSTAQQHGNEAFDSISTLGQLILSNGQFRKLLNDATILLRDMVGDAAQEAANRVNPSEDELNQIDRPAEDDTWHDTPDLSNIKGRMRDQFNKQTPFSREDLKNAAGDATQGAHPSGSRDPADAAKKAGQDQRHGTDSGVDAQEGARQGVQSLKDKASQNIPDETKDRMRETKDKARDKTKNYMNEKLPKERRDQAIYRLKKMVVEIQGHSDYHRAIDTLLRLAEEYTGHAKNLTSQTTGTVRDAHSDNSLSTVETEVKTLLERFANFTSFDDLTDSINAIYRDADRDPELKKFFQRLNRFIRRCLKEQGYILEDASTEEWNQISDQGDYLLRDRYRNHTDRVLDEVKFLGSQFDEDRHNKAFADAMNKLFQNLGNDENGKPTFKPHLLKDLSDVIVPGIFENVRYVPVPRIEYSDPMIDAIVENLVIESDNLTPNMVEFGSDNWFRWGRKSVGSKHKNKVMMAVSGVQMDLKDVSYFIHKKQGFPSIKDKGVLDVYLGGSGFSFKVGMETADDKDRYRFFKVNSVVVDVKNLNIKLKQSSHKTLFGIFKPLLLRVVSPVIQKVLEKQIRDSINQLDGMAWGIYQEAERVAKEAKNNPEQAQNIYQRYLSAAQKKLTQGKQKSKEAAQDKKVNVALTQHDSIFKNIQLPGGISTKATEYKNLAAKGERWESPIFTIGSARETTNLPQVSSVGRKRHHATQGGVRGNQNVGQTSNATGTAGMGRGDMGSSGMGRGYDSGATAVGSSATRTAGVSTGAYEYGQNEMSSYGSGTSGGYGQTNGTAGFSNQVNQAFEGGATDYRLKQATGLDGANLRPVDGTAHTLLGTHNPVLTGSV